MPLGCLGVCVLLVAFGIPIAVPLTNDLVEEIRIHRSYVETQCTVVQAIAMLTDRGSSRSSGAL